MRIVLVGGGTGGATTPLIAIAEEIKKRNTLATFLFIGTRHGPEAALAQSASIPFISIFAGKLRRYFSIQNVVDVFITVIGTAQAFFILRKVRPDMIVSVGSYVAVPVVWAARILKIPSIIHQQDVVRSLSNALCARFATAITVTFKESLTYFPASKTTWIGNPMRQELLFGSADRGYERFGLHRQLPVILAFGGGTGSQRINQLITEVSLNLVTSFQIIHLTGSREELAHVSHSNYHAYEFLTDAMADAYAVANIVICRAGLSTLTEIAALGKPTIVIPLPHSHQEANAEYFEQRDAVVVLHEERLTRELFKKTIVDLYHNMEKRTNLVENARTIARPHAAIQFVDTLYTILLPRMITKVTHTLSRSIRELHFNEPISRHTHFKIGGPADLLVVCATAADVVFTYRTLLYEGMPHTILGGGTNVLFSDAGFRGVVLKITNSEFEVIGDEVSVGAGMGTVTFVKRCLEHNLTGAEFLIGIFGTVGGAVRGNAGSFGKEMKDIVVSCQVLTESGTIETWTNENLLFGYRDSIAKRRRIIVLTVRVRLTRGDPRVSKQVITRNITYKKEHQPLEYPSAGCMFKNYVCTSESDPLRTTFMQYINNDSIPAWAFIKEAGLSGKRIGDIQISEKHANFFINLGHGTAEQVIILKSIVKQKVRELYNVQLEEEVQFIS